MKLIFVENRYATLLYEAVARRLQHAGHEVHWIVQNPLFVPRQGKSHRIPFPVARSEFLPVLDEKLLSKIASSDRQVRYFGANTAHYPHYFSEIAKILSIVRPDFVFGESTQFYELMVIEHCRAIGVRYLNPINIGYPRGRMCFLEFDSRRPFGGAQKTLEAVKVHAAIEQINRRQVVPGYMEPSSYGLVQRVSVKLLDLARIATGWLLGERFATPSPLRKLRLELLQKRLKRRWDIIASSRSIPNGPYMLYALHVQPECSIDVWGCPWTDQVEVIRRVAEALKPIGIALAVKPHPSSKYEISDRLCDVVESLPCIGVLPTAMKMKDAFDDAAGVLGLTGTVLLEAVFAGKPAISLAQSGMSAYPGITVVSSPEAVPEVLQSLMQVNPQQRTKNAHDLYQWLHRVSYPGEICEPLHSREKIADRYMQPLSEAFQAVISPANRTGTI